MTTIRFSKFFSLLSEIIILGIVFLIPLFFSAVFVTANVFELNKAVLFKVLVILLFFITTINVFLNNKYRQSSIERARRLLEIKNIKILFIFLLLFLLFTVISSLFSVDPGKSIYGLYDRQQGFIMQLYYAVFFILVLFNIKDLSQIKRIFFVIILASVIACLYGLAQKLGYDFMDWDRLSSTTNRITATLGQPNYLAMYLLLVMPVTIYYLIINRLALRVFTGIALALQLLCFYFTYSFSAWLSAIFGIIIIAALYILFNKTLGTLVNKKLFKNNNNIKNITIIALTILILFSAFLGAIYTNNTLSRKISGLFRLEGSAAARINYWQAGMDAAKERLLLGYGPETQGDVLAAYYQNDWGRLNRVNSIPNRAHNIVIDILLTIGLVGLIILAGLVIMFLKIIAANIKNNQSIPLSYVFLSIFIFYFLFLLLNFSFITASVYIWLGLALLILVSAGLRDSEKDESTISNFFNSSLFKLKAKGLVAGKIIFSSLLFGLASTLIFQQVSILKADYYYFNLLKAANANDFYTVNKLSGYIGEENVRSSHYQLLVADVLSDIMKDLDDAVLKASIGKYLKTEFGKIHTSSYSNKFLKANVAAVLAEKQGDGYYVLADIAYQDIISFSSDLPKSYSAYGYLFYKTKQYDEAIVKYNQAISLIPPLTQGTYYPPIQEQAIKDELFKNNYWLGNIYLNLGQFSEAEKYYLLALDYNPNSLNSYYRIAQFYFKNNDIDRAILFCLIGYDRDPGGFAWPYTLSKLYYRKGDLNNALMYSEKALQFNTNSSEMNDFKNKIELELGSK